MLTWGSWSGSCGSLGTISPCPPLTHETRVRGQPAGPSCPGSGAKADGPGWVVMVAGPLALTSRGKRGWGGALEEVLLPLVPCLLCCQPVPEGPSMLHRRSHSLPSWVELRDTAGEAPGELAVPGDRLRGPDCCSVAQSCRTLCDPVDCSTPGLPVHHQLPELAQTHVPRVSDAIQPSHPLSSPSPPAPNPSQHQGLF